MAETKTQNETNAQAPEGCTHVCGSCDAECEFNSKGTPGKFWQALDDFSRVDSDDLLKALEEVSKDD